MEIYFFLLVYLVHLNDEYNFYEDLDALVISFAILLPIKSLVASVLFFLIALFEAVFIASVVDFSVLSRSFWNIFII